MFVGCIAFHVGAGILTIGIAIQSIQHQLDSWLVIMFIGMIVVKTGARIYADKRL